MQVPRLELADDLKRRVVRQDGQVLRKRFAATAVAWMAFMGIADADAPVATVKPIPQDAAGCEAAAKTQPRPSAACLGAAEQLADEAHGYHAAGDDRAAQPFLDHASRFAPRDLRVSLEQALVDDASGHYQDARKRYDFLRGTSIWHTAAVPSAINLALLGRFDDARAAFAALSGSADSSEAGYAQLWQLWLDARTWRGDAVALRETLARNAVGLRADDAPQQAILNLFAGQGSVDAVFAAIEATTPENSLRRRDARAEAAFFVGGYVQYALRDTAAAQRLYLRELPQAASSVERPVIQQSMRSL